MLGQFQAVLPKHITPERFGRVVLTAIQNSPELLDCDRRSLWNAAMRAANDGLLPDGRLGAIVIYKGKAGRPQAQWMPMIAGLRQKVRNSGEIESWEAQVVHERDQWEYQQGGPVIAAYSIAKFKSGELSREWMWIEELDKVRAVSKAVRGPWADWADEMYRKTVARRHAKVLPMSSDLDDLLRRPDEPDDDDGKPVEHSPEPQRLGSMTDALDMIAADTKKRGTKYKPTAEMIDELDAETGEVLDQDQGEYAEGDDELPPQDEQKRA
jgi:recombination protein RecT